MVRNSGSRGGSGDAAAPTAAMVNPTTLQPYNPTTLQPTGNLLSDCIVGEAEDSDLARLRIVARFGDSLSDIGLVARRDVRGVDTADFEDSIPANFGHLGCGST